jgi:hypothetical protein
VTRRSKETVDDVPLGEYEGDIYYINVARQPGSRDEWCVSVVRSESAANTNVVRIDTDHGEPHLDKPWLPPAQRNKDWLGSDFTVDDAIDHFTEEWRVYAWRYAYYREGRDVTEPR